MKKYLSLLFSIYFLSLNAQNSHTIIAVGNTFSPDTLTVTIDDTISFNIGSTHNAVEVSDSTWIANGTASNGGFNIPFGGGTFIPTTAQTYYYVCQPHVVTMGMKGVIIANALPIYGCTDSTACNYDSLATIDDSSCVYPTSTTTTITACDSYTWLVNGVTYTTSVIDTVIGINAAGCTETTILNITINVGGGCTDSLASNYDSLATCDNGSCIYPSTYAPIFFSEYGEGSSNNKYFEVYNPTNDTINLSNYAFARVSNSPGNGIGVYEYWVDFDSGAVILPNDVYVVAHPSADSFILAEADMSYGSLSNGNDGFALVYGAEPPSPVIPDSGGYFIVDWLGDWNGDPGSGWDVAGVNNATANHTLIRKCDVTQGDTSWVNAAGTNTANSQWIVKPSNYWNNIGYHEYNTSIYDTLTFTICNGLSVTVGTNTYDSTGIYIDVLTAANWCDSVVVTDLTVLSSSISVIVNDVTICDGDSVVVDTNVYNQSGTYIATLVNSAGCDSIITTNLTIQTPTYQNLDICNGDSVVVGSSVYNSTGIYTDTIQSSIGCDSIVHTNLTTYSQFNSIFGGIPNNTVGGGGFYNGSQYLELSAYMPSELVSAMVYAQDTTLTTFQIRDDNGNVLDSTTINVIPGGHRIYFNFPMAGGSDYQLGIDGNSTNLFRNNNGVNYPYNFNTLASITGSSAGGQYYYFFYDIEIKQSSQPNNYSICAGDSIVVGGNVYNASGLYTDSLTSSIGCDSLVFTNLMVYPNSTFSNPQNICSGGSYSIGNNVYDSTGVYSDTLVAANGCDSVVTTTLTVSSSSVSITTNNFTICDGDSIVVNGNVYNSTALYSDTLTNSVGCDSIINTNLTVQTPINLSFDICSGDSVIVGSSMYNTNGNYSDTLISSLGCDSIINTNLTTLFSYNSVFGGITDTTVASGGFYNSLQHQELDCYMPSEIVSALVYAQDTNTITFELRTNNGSVLDDITLQVLPGAQRIYLNFEMPIATNLQLGIAASNSGLYRSNQGVNYPYDFDNFAAITGSSAGGQYYYFFYDVEIRLSTQPTHYAVCSGDSIHVGNSIYYTSGYYVDSLTSVGGCDSIVYTDLAVHPHVSYSNIQTICSGEVTIVGSNVYDSTGVYVDTLYNAFGCDSVVTTILTVLNISASTGTNNQTICFGDSVSIGTSVYYYDGVYNDTIQSSNGCDSIVTTTLTTLTANYTSIFGGILDSSSAPGAFSTWNGYLELTCSNISNISSAKVYALDTNTITFELRDNNGIVLEDETIIVYPGQQRVNLNFTIPVGNDFQLGISSGNSGLYRSNAGQGNSQLYPFNIGPVSITGSNASDQYYYFFYDVEITPNITINTLRICNGESVTINGNVYDSTGVYTDKYTASNGCDSIVETKLTVDTAVTAQISQNGVNLDANVNGGTSPYSYIWSSGEISQSITPLANGSYWVIATDTNICISDTAFYVVTFIPSGVDDILNSDIDIYPNPTDGLINIMTDLKIEKIEVFSIEGKLLKTTMESYILLDVKGIYFIKIFSESAEIIKRVVVN